jgi:hypothetical protein
MNPWYAVTYEVSREIVDEKLGTAHKTRLSRGARIGRKMQNLTKGVFRS